MSERIDRLFIYLLVCSCFFVYLRRSFVFISLVYLFKPSLKVFDFMNNVILPFVKSFFILARVILKWRNCISLLVPNALQLCKHNPCFLYLVTHINFALNLLNHDLFFLHLILLWINCIYLLFCLGEHNYSELLQEAKIFLQCIILLIELCSALIYILVLDLCYFKVSINNNTNHKVQHNSSHKQYLHNEHHIHDNIVKILEPSLVIC